MKNRNISHYPPDEWKIIEETFNPDMMPRNEIIFALGNGYIGMGGDYEETSKFFHRGTYLNGFYESEPIIYGEAAYGYAENRQTILNVTNGRIIELLVDNEPFDLLTGTILRYKRSLDMKSGQLIREVLWQSPSGKRIEIRVVRIVLFNYRHLAALSYSVHSTDKDAELILKSSLDGNVRNQSRDSDPRIGTSFDGQILKHQTTILDGTGATICHVTKNTNFNLVCSMENHLATKCHYTVKNDQSGNQAAVIFSIDARRGEKIELSKYIAYYTSLDHHDDLVLLVQDEVRLAKERGFKYFASCQHQFLNTFWEKSDIHIEGDIAVQQGLRFNLFHLLQSADMDGKTSIPAKGLTGEGYEGHYFWDTEIYVLPFFIYCNPHTARKILEYRYSILDKARQRACIMSQKGVLFPWRTITGEETSAYYPAGTAQYHINADIIYAMRKYIDTVGDLDFLKDSGAEMLFETARFWFSLGDFIPGKDNRFCLNCVTGPDEYTAVVNNNTYTNLMAKDNLEYAVKIAAWLKKSNPDEFKRIAGKIELIESEIDEWKKAAEEMFIHFDKEHGIYAQDDSFLTKAVWDFPGTPEDNYPLLLHYHPLVIYRYQVLKQPDVVLAMFLQGNRFSTAEKKRCFDYYNPLTTGDSSLSPCIQSIAAAEIGYTELAYDYFMKTARMDLDDISENVKYGVHTAAMGGTWLSLVYGFAGMRDYEGRLSFNPGLPEPWKRLRFRLIVQGRSLEIDIGKQSVAYTLHSGPDFSITHRGTETLLSTGKQVTVDISPKIEAVIFDLDGVITDTAEYHYRAWKKLSDMLKIPFDRKFNENLKGISRMDSLNILLKHGGKVFPNEEKQVLTDSKNEYYQSLIKDITPGDLLPGIDALLRDLRAEGIKIAVASVSRNAEEVIKRLQIEDLIDFKVDPSAVVKTKPDPEIFLIAADKLNIPYRNCVGIEDAEVGIKAIKSAGMFSVGIGKHLKDADWSVKDTTELTLSGLKEHYCYP